MSASLYNSSRGVCLAITERSSFGTYELASRAVARCNLRQINSFVVEKTVNESEVIEVAHDKEDKK